MLRRLPARVSAQITRHTAMSPGRPFSARSPSGSATTEPTVSPCAVGPISTSPGSADCWSRAATFSASPVANVESPDSATTSPDSIPIRAARPCPSVSRIAVAARTARSASSSWAVGTPNTATTASPANFSTVPP
jgi:hypothetical protein